MGSFLTLGFVFCASLLILLPKLSSGQTFQWGSSWGPGSKRSVPEALDPDTFAAIRDALGLSGPLQSDGPTGRCAIAPVIKRTIIELLQYEWSRIKSTCPDGGRLRSEPARKAFKNTWGNSSIDKYEKITAIWNVARTGLICVALTSDANFSAPMFCFSIGQ